MKRKLKLAEPDGSGAPPKWIYAEAEDVASVAARNYARLKRQADREEQKARVAAQETAKAEEASAMRTSRQGARNQPQEVVRDEDVSFEVTLPKSPEPRRPGAKTQELKDESGREVKKVGRESDGAIEFQVSLTGVADREAQESRVRDLSREAVRWPEVTASARKRTCVEKGGEWDPFFLRLLEDAFTSSSLVVLVVDTVAMTERWWPKWGEMLEVELGQAGCEKPKVLGSLIHDDLHDLVTVLSRRGVAPRLDHEVVAPMVKAFQAWTRRPDSKLFLVAPLKDAADLVFSPLDGAVSSLGRLFALSRALAGKVETLVCWIRRSFRDYAALQRAAEALTKDTKCTVYIATQISEKDADFPKLHPPFQTAVRFWLQGRSGDITPRCTARPYGRPAVSVVTVMSDAEDSEEAEWGNPASAERCVCSSSSRGTVRVAEGCPLHGQKAPEAEGSSGKRSNLSGAKVDQEKKPAGGTAGPNSGVYGAQATSRALTEAAGADAKLKAQSELPRQVQEGLKVMQVAEADSAYDFAKDADRRVGGVLRFLEGVQNEVCAAVFYKLRATARHGLVMKDLADGDSALLTSGWTYFLGVMHSLEPEADARKVAVKAYADLVQGAQPLNRFNVQFMAAYARLAATGSARHCTFDSLAGDYIERLTNQSLRLVVTQAFNVAKAGWASNGPLGVTGREALKKLLTEAADLVNKSRPGPAVQAASAAALRAWSPSRDGSERGNQPRREEGRIPKMEPGELKQGVQFGDLTPEDKAVVQHWAGAEPTLFLAYVAAARENGVCYRCGKTGHWAREGKCAETERRPCLDYARGKCRWGTACLFGHDLRTRPRVPQEQAPPLVSRRRPRSPTPPRSAAAAGSGRANRGVCFEWKERGSCIRGRGCNFSHEQHGVRAAAGAIKLCFEWKDKGECRFGSKCRFAHEPRGRQEGPAKKARHGQGERKKEGDGSENGGGAPR